MPLVTLATVFDPVAAELGRELINPMSRHCVMRPNG
jgi:hypothetical protein